MQIKPYENVRSIAEKYDVFVVDLWGVIHDGVVAYPGVNDCLANLKKAGKTIIFLSNAPRRAALAITGLEKVGVPAHLYDKVLTSGEVSYEYIKSGAGNFGKKYIIIGPERDAGLISDLDYQRVENPAEANFGIITGFEEDSSTLEEKIPLLQELKKHNLPLICANPDLVIVRQTGVRALCAGVMAEEYAKMGGKIKQFGKPYGEVYNKIFSDLAGTPKARIAAIGDSLKTDIAGANAAGIDSYLIAGGILGEELGIKHGQLPAAEKLLAVCNKEGTIPKGVLPEFIW